MKICDPIKNHYSNSILKQNNNIPQIFSYKMNKIKTNHKIFLGKKHFCLTFVFILKYNLRGIN